MSTYYSVKYLFSQGILEREECHLTEDGKYIKNDSPQQYDYIFERLGRDAFATREEAVKRAVKMCSAKLYALKKQKTKVESIQADMLKEQLATFAASQRSE